jgi:hypothetical protein
VARRQGRIARHVHERLRLGVVDGRTITADEPAEEVRADLGGGVGREHVSEDRRSSPEHGAQQSEEQPEKTDTTEVRESDEDGIEPVGPVVDDPAFEPPVEVDQVGRSCFVDSMSCCGLKGLPMKPCAPREAAVRRSSSSTLPLNMITGIDPTP